MKRYQLSLFVFILIVTLCSSGSSPNLVDTPPSSQDFISCLQSNSNNVTFVSQLVFTPNNSSFQSVWQERVINLRFLKPSTPKPCVIMTPVDESQIQTILLCTKRNGYKLKIRSGGHDLEGLSYIAESPFVMLDFVNMRSIDVNVADRSVWVQSGALLGELYYAISQKTNTLYFPGGNCITVGVGGHLSGGGYGNLFRKYGIAADHVLDVRFMDVNGNILDRKSMGEDLFWALRGGGGSSFGIVIAWKLHLVPVPETVTVFKKNITLEENATDIFYKYQYVAPSIDRDLLLRVQIFSQKTNNYKKTIRIMFEGLYLGKINTLMPLLDKSFPELKVRREICEEMSMAQSGLVLEVQTFTSSTPTATLANRTAIGDSLNHKVKSDYVRTPIAKSEIKKIWRKMFENDGSEVVIIYPFGGRMKEYSETATPYPHRAGVLYEVIKCVNFFDQTSDTTPVSVKRIDWLRRFDKFLEPYVSKNPREAYLNYIDLDLGVGSGSYEEASVWGERYWKRPNFKKLIRIKARVDPDNFFSRPQSIPVFSTSLSDM